MHDNMTLISTLAAAFGLALVLGLLAQWARLPALVGYLLAGVLIGPYTPGFVGDVHLAQQLSEVGVMLLMFGVGLHFSVGDLMSVKGIALPGALVQMAAATAMGAGLAHGWWGWDLAASLIFGLALSVASTVVLLRALESRELLHTGNGRIAVGWLVVEDLAMVLALVLIPVLGGKGEGGAGSSLAVTIVTTLLAVAAFVAVMLIAGRRLLPWMLWQVNRTGSRELFTLATVAAAVGLAVGAAALFGVSVALGAFFAGLVLRESAFSERAAHESLPLRDAFAVLFFVAVGMLFDPRILIQQPLAVLATVAVILVGANDTLSRFAKGIPLPTTVAEYASVYDAIIRRTRSALPHVRLVLCEPFTLPGTRNNGHWPAWQKDMAERQAVVRNLARAHRAAFVPLQGMFEDACRRAPAEYWIWDGVHPTGAGHQLIADQWLHVVNRSA